jgi:YVTN family beta-propeller protein
MIFRATGSAPATVSVRAIPGNRRILFSYAFLLTLSVSVTFCSQGQTIAAGTNPFAIAVNPLTNKLYVANIGSANVTVIDGATSSTSTVPVGTSPRALAVNPNTNKIYVATNGSANVTVIDGATNNTSTIVSV